MNYKVSLPLTRREVEYLLILVKEDIPQATQENRRDMNVELHNLLGDAHHALMTLDEGHRLAKMVADRITPEPADAT